MKSSIYELKNLNTEIMSKKLKNQIRKMSLALVVILSLVSCTKEKNNPYPTPTSGSYNISKNDSSGISNLYTEAEIVDLLSEAAPTDGVYKTGRIIAENSKPRLDMQYLFRSREIVTLSIPLTNSKGYLDTTDKGTLTKSDGTVIANPIINQMGSKKLFVGHVTLLR